MSISKKKGLHSLSTMSRGQPMASSWSAEPFSKARLKILRQIHTDVTNGKPFTDLNLHLCTRRDKLGNGLASKVLAINKQLLLAASPGFEQIFAPDSPESQEDGYVDDSDLEEDDDKPMDSTGDTASGDQSSVINGESGDCTAEGEHDFVHLSRPTDGVEDTQPLSEDVLSSSASEMKTDQVTEGLQEPLPIGAFSTWQALALYLCSSDDHITFKPLRSSTIKRNCGDEGDIVCSPKSMYRLADKLGLPDPKVRAKASMLNYLSEDNIIVELFSDFTWRYPDVLEMEAKLFRSYSQKKTVKDALDAILVKVAKGELLHSHVVLSSLFSSLT